MEGEHVLESGSGVKMMAEGLLRENEEVYEVIGDRPTTLLGQSPLSLRSKPLDKPFNLPLS
jgi:hypothetical protein